MPGGSITVSNGAGDTLAVTLTGGVWKAAADLSGSNVSFPDTITTSKTYYTGVDTPGVVVGVTRNTVQIANTPDGTRTVNIEGNKNLTFTPGSDPEKRISPAEMAVLFHPKITAAAPVEIDDATGDEDEEAREALQDVIDALVAAGILEAVPPPPPEEE
jgi:hypothetical protein